MHAHVNALAQITCMHACQGRIYASKHRLPVPRGCVSLSGRLSELTEPQMLIKVVQVLNSDIHGLAGIVQMGAIVAGCYFTAAEGRALLWNGLFRRLSEHEPHGLLHAFYVELVRAR